MHAENDVDQTDAPVRFSAEHETPALDTIRLASQQTPPPPLPDAPSRARSDTPHRREWSTALDFTEERMLRPVKVAPSSGWRRWLYGATFGALNPGISPAERAERALVGRVKTPIAGSRRIAVISRKGGVGKTTTTVMLGHTFAARRGDRVVAMDGNPDAGSLGYRVRLESAATITSLLKDRDGLRRYADVRAYTSQASSRLEVVASDGDPRITHALSAADYRAAINVLDRHYNLILLDTGTGVLDSGIQGILRESDQLVVVLPPALDGARVAASTLDWLEQHGYEDLVRTAVAVVNGVRPGGGLVAIERMEAHFDARCAATVRIPWDPHLEAGGETVPSDLRPATQRAYLDVAAAVADSFPLGSPRAVER